MLTATTKDGTTVQQGDTVTDFRGDTATFVCPTRAASTGKSGKVLVEEDGHRREYYDKVFGLTVTSS
jgi:hypothetical protein